MMVSKKNTGYIDREKLLNASNDDLLRLLEKTSSKLYQTELLLSVTQKISGIRDLSRILWTLIEITTDEIGADRGSIFLNDPLTGELYSRVAQGNLTREIRLLNTTGLAGAVFKSGIGEIVHQPYKDAQQLNYLSHQRLL